MEVLEHSTHLNVQEYLEGELQSEIRHEYVSGLVYAMAGASAEHNLISGNIFAALHSHLRGKACRTFMADMKVRLTIANEDIFYYPDVMVTCDSRDTDRYFKNYPTAIIEVLSPETERTDRREKFLSYIQIQTLEEYVLIAQDKSQVTIFRRKENWSPEVINVPEQQLRLLSIDFAMPLSSIYEGVKI